MKKSEYNEHMNGMQFDRADRDQSGFAAMIIAIVLVLVLSLTTVGFADLMRKEERSALDKHLSSQAYYAAESGVNDAAKAINAGFSDAKTDCGNTHLTATSPGVQYLSKTSIGDNTGNDYTCLLIDPSPKNLEYSSVDAATNSKTFTITGINPADSNDRVPIHKIVFGWQDSGGGADFVDSGTDTFGQATNWTHTGVLRISITPLASGHIGRDYLDDNTYTAYLYPRASSVAAAPKESYFPGFLASNAGVVVEGNCNVDNPLRSGPTQGDTPRYCNVAVTGLDETNYLVDVRSIYKSSHVTVLAYGGNTGTDVQLRIKNAQTMIDSTGRAQDVLRRIQVRIPSKNTYVRSNYALETTNDICKQLQLYGPADTGSTAQCAP